MDQLIVALGNPGSQYKLTRHNIGWMALEKLSFFPSLRWQEKFKGLYSIQIVNNIKYYFLMPQTFMNLSGESVYSLASFFKIEISNILVIHDELDLAFGTLALKKGGGLAGHNGLKSIASCLGTQDFLRFRLGIGRPIHGSVSDWVLGQFSESEKIVKDNFLLAAAEGVETYMAKGFDLTASKYSKKVVI